MRNLTACEVTRAIALTLCAAGAALTGCDTCGPQPPAPPSECPRGTLEVRVEEESFCVVASGTSIEVTGSSGARARDDGLQDEAR